MIVSTKLSAIKFKPAARAIHSTDNVDRVYKRNFLPKKAQTGRNDDFVKKTVC